MKLTKNYTYGVRSVESEISIDDAIYNAHKYRNKLCSLELEKRKRYHELLRKLAPGYLAACEEVEEAEKQLGINREKIQEERKKQRTKKPQGCETYRKNVSEIKSQLKELRLNRKEAKTKAMEDEIVIAAIEANQEWHKTESRIAKQESGLYWGTEAIIKSSCASFRTGPPPRFKRYEGEGQLAVQLQGGLDCAEAHDENKLFCIFAKEGEVGECLIRVGSDESRQPVFAKARIVFHRNLPEGRIKWAYLERRKLANKVKWSIRATIECEVSVNRDTKSSVSVHFGWASQAGGIRSAMWLGSDGKQGSIVLAKKHCDDYARLDAIDSQRDRLFNETKEQLATFLDSADDLPEFLQDVKLHVRKWRSPARLAMLMSDWRKSDYRPNYEVEIKDFNSISVPGRQNVADCIKLLRIAELDVSVNEKGYGTINGKQVRISNHYPVASQAETMFCINRLDDGIYAVCHFANGSVPISIYDLVTRRNQIDLRLWQHQRRLSKRIYGRRKNIYRQVAFDLAKNYGVLYYAPIQSAKLTENLPPEAMESDKSTVHRHAKWAAVSELQRMLLEKFPLHAIKVDSKYISIECSDCGHINPRPENRDRIQCDCGKTFQMDENALRVTAARGQERQKNGALLELKKELEIQEKSKRDRLLKMQEANRKARLSQSNS